MRPQVYQRVDGGKSVESIVESDKFWQFFVDDCHRIILIVNCLRQQIVTNGIKPDSLAHNTPSEAGRCIEYGQLHLVIFREMAIIWANVEGVRLIFEVVPDIWSYLQLLSIVDNCEKIVAYFGVGIETYPHIHVLGVYEAWQLVVGGLVEPDYLVFQGSQKVGFLIRDGHFEREEMFRLLLLAIRKLAFDVIHSNVPIPSSFDLHYEILFFGICVDLPLICDQAGGGVVRPT